MKSWTFFRLLPWLCLLLAGSGIAVELASPPKVTLDGTAAVLSWRTDVPCGTRVSYGRDPQKLDRKYEGGVTDAHEARLEGLETGATYYYSVGSARQKLASGSFTVGAPAAEPAPPPPTPPTPKKGLLGRVLDALSPASPTPPEAQSPGARAPPPPARETWGRMETLQDHFDRHGPDFQSRGPEEYAAQAWQFLQRARAGELAMKWDASDATLRVWDPATRAFAAYNQVGRTKTYFRPNSAGYWQRQPGRLVKPADLPALLAR